jgi:transposase-like protein
MDDVEGQIEMIRMARERFTMETQGRKGAQTPGMMRPKLAVSDLAGRDVICFSQPSFWRQEKGRLIEPSESESPREDLVAPESESDSPRENLVAPESESDSQ